MENQAITDPTRYRGKPVLYWAPFDYSSKLARFALRRAKIDFSGHLLDAYIQQEQFDPWYCELCTKMITPVLSTSGTDKPTQSVKEIVLIAWPIAENQRAEVNLLIDIHDTFSLDELTIATLITRVPGGLKLLHRWFQKAKAKLTENSASHPGYSQWFEAKIKELDQKQVFYESDPVTLRHERSEIAIEHIERLEAMFDDKRPFMLGSQFTAADVYWLMFLDRLKKLGYYSVIKKHPRLTKYLHRASE